jgi:hypothetical protein
MALLLESGAGYDMRYLKTTFDLWDGSVFYVLPVRYDFKTLLGFIWDLQAGDEGGAAGITTNKILVPFRCTRELIMSNQ